MTQEALQLRRKFLEVRERLKKIIFGPDQEFGIDVFTNACLVPTQWEEWNRPTHTVLFLGPPGSGKTTLGESIAHQVDAKFTTIAGLGDMTPSQLVGHTEYIRLTKDGDEEREVYRQGSIKVGINIVVFDEVSRANRELFNAFAHLLAAGKIMVSGVEVDIAPHDEPLIVVCTANPLFSSGTREIGDFLVDRVIASTIFRTPWHDDQYLNSLLSPSEHWRKIREDGLLTPILHPKDVTKIQHVFGELTKTTPEIRDYIKQIIRVVVGLSRPDWVSAFSKKSLPSAWRGFKRLPREPFMHEVGGRVAQHLESLARADSFLTYDSTCTTVASVQRMTRAVFCHRIMYRLREGGQDILDAVYGNEIIPFLFDTLEWIVSTVPPPGIGRKK